MNCIFSLNSDTAINLNKVLAIQKSRGENIISISVWVLGKESPIVVYYATTSDRDTTYNKLLLAMKNFEEDVLM